MSNEHSAQLALARTHQTAVSYSGGRETRTHKYLADYGFKTIPSPTSLKHWFVISLQVHGLVTRAAFKSKEAPTA